MSDIQALLQRLEQVASRLESVEKQLAKGGSGAAPAASSGAAAGGASSAGASSASVTEFDALVEQHLKPFIQGGNSFGDAHLQKIVGLLDNLVKTQRSFLQAAASSKKPSDADAQKLWEAGSKIQQDITALRESKEARASKQFNHLSAISEGSPAFHWVLVTPTPGPFVADSRAASDFYANRILKEFKGVDQKQVDWINHWTNFLKELQNYVKQHHTTGLSWNAQGGAAPSSLSGASSAPAPAGGSTAGGPPAGGPPPAPKGTPPAAGSAAPPVGAALFAQINQGTGISGGLKHVTKDMKTKNLPADQRSSVVKADDLPSKKATTTTTAKAAAAPAKPPRIELEGNKWCVEFVKNKSDVKITETEPKQTIYAFKCENTVIQIEGKINGVVLDGCKKVQVVFHTAIANVEVINSSSIKIQCLGTVPNWSIDKCSDVLLYLSKEGYATTQIVSSKSDAMNVSFPSDNPDTDHVEAAIPEQFITTIVNGKLVTEQVRHE